MSRYPDPREPAPTASNTAGLRPEIMRVKQFAMVSWYEILSGQMAEVSFTSLLLTLISSQISFIHVRFLHSKSPQLVFTTLWHTELQAEPGLIFFIFRQITFFTS